MTSINTSIANSNYYQLSNSSSGNASAGSTSDLLLQAIGGSNTNNASTSNDAYTLSLSSAAQNYLNATGTTSSTGTTSTSDTFQLSTKQIQTISDILAKYKDAPYTQDTFNKIQDDLKAAGLGSTTLQAQDKAKSFNATSLLINYLNGNFTAGNATIPSASQEQSKYNNFIHGVIKQWQSLSTTYKDSAGSSVSATSSSGGA